MFKFSLIRTDLHECRFSVGCELKDFNKLDELYSGIKRCETVFEMLNEIGIFDIEISDLPILKTNNIVYIQTAKTDTSKAMDHVFTICEEFIKKSLPKDFIIST